MWWYPIYLTYDSPNKFLFGCALLLPQLFLLLLIAFLFSQHDLPLAVFLQTAVFVVFNKVFTGQYFAWYLSLLPLVLPNLSMPKRRVFTCIAAFVLGLGLWLFNAYMLEIQGRHFYCAVWVCSIIFFLVNVGLICQLLNHYSPHKSSTFK